jgi:hypothetical protein
MTSLSKLLAGSAAAVSVLAGASAANAATIFDLITISVPGSDFFGALITDEAGAFVHVFNFNIADSADASSTVTTIELGSTDIDFTSISLDGFAFTQTGFDPAAENWELTAAFLGAGAHSITVSGSVVGASQDGAYSGVLNLASVPIPEPGAWAMMILGFGGIGGMMRQRRRPVAA